MLQSSQPTVADSRMSDTHISLLASSTSGCQLFFCHITINILLPSSSFLPWKVSAFLGPPLHERSYQPILGSNLISWLLESQVKASPVLSVTG